MDRGYDGRTWFSLASKAGMWFAARAKSSRKYSVPSMKNRRLGIGDIQSAVKGRYSFRFPEPDEREARCYVTDHDCSSKAGCETVLKCYRLRWRIEEMFRFLKVFFGVELFMVRSVDAINWLLLAASVATAFFSRMCAERTPAYWQCRAAFKSFEPDLTDEQIIEREGHIPVELYRIGGGASRILQHCSKKPTPKGRDRTRHGYIQLRLDGLF